MYIEFDPHKSEKNRIERGLPFEYVRLFDWQSAVIIPDIRFDYPEARFTATGFIGERLYIICFTPIYKGVRVISFRKANKREVRKYELEKTSD